MFHQKINKLFIRLQRMWDNLYRGKKKKKKKKNKKTLSTEFLTKNFTSKPSTPTINLQQSVFSRK